MILNILSCAFLSSFISMSMKWLFISILQFANSQLSMDCLFACLNADCSLCIPDALPLSDV